MRYRSLVFVVSAVATVAIGHACAAEQSPVPLFTSDDLDRMFGPAPTQPRDPVDKSGPEDWRWVEAFLDREYARIEADRQLDLRSREIAVAAARAEEPARIYGGSSIWGGYPAFAWRNGARRRDSGWLNRIDRAPSVANRTPRGGGNANRTGPRSK